MEELIAFDSQVGDLHAKISREPVSFKTNEENKYDIIFAGSDKVLGTADDIKADGDIQIQKILDELKKDWVCMRLRPTVKPLGGSSHRGCGTLHEFKLVENP